MFLRLTFLGTIITLLCGCSAATVKPPPGAEQGQPVYIVSHGWHTGFVYPRDKLVELLPALGQRFPTGRYLEMGWGDEGFYQAEEITSGITLRALVWPTDSVVHIVAVPHSAKASFGHSEIRVACLQAGPFDALGRFLVTSFARDEQGRIQPGEPGLYGDSQFYTGAGSYHLFNTCNQWTAEGLQSAGFDIIPGFRLTASSIMNYLDDNADPTCQ